VKRCAYLTNKIGQVTTHKEAAHTNKKPKPPALANYPSFTLNPKRGFETDPENAYHSPGFIRATPAHGR
jgi:hypothetical protein